RWRDVLRDYSSEDVLKLRPSLKIEYSLAKHTAKRLWDLLNSEHHVRSLGAMTGAQAVQMVKAGLQSIYLSGWQVAADANLAGHTFP
ncbi:isocitrate lyase, partial [Klebsiella pneumoniae]